VQGNCLAGSGGAADQPVPVGKPQQNEFGFGAIAYEYAFWRSFHPLKRDTTLWFIQ
jgi:hypothetical protein